MSEQDNERDEPQVIYVEADRGVGARWRRARQAGRQMRDQWVANAVDAQLPDQVGSRMPDWASQGRGQVWLGVIAVAAVLVWALVLTWVMG